MNEFNRIIERKIGMLEDDLARIQDKIGLLREVLESEGGEDSASSPKKRGRGRPKGSKGKKKGVESKHAIDDALYQESLNLSPKAERSTLELQQRMIERYKTRTQPIKTPKSLGPGIKAGPKKVLAAIKQAEQAHDDAHITIEDD